MPFDQLISRPLTQIAVGNYAPTVSGVYGLSNAREWIYIGETDNIQQTLSTHLQGFDTPVMKRQPTEFVFEVCDRETRPARQDRLVLEYEPICNRHSSCYAALTKRESRTNGKRSSAGSVKMQFTLIGFSQDTGFRVFAFEGTAADRTRTEYRVRADLALLRKYDIRVQELPLLCRELLERRGEGEPPCTVTFTEDEMSLHARTCAEARNAAAQKRRSTRRPPTNQIGSGWRAPQQ